MFWVYLHTKMYITRANLNEKSWDRSRNFRLVDGKQEIAAQLLSILPKYTKLDGTEYYLYMSPYFEFKISFKLKTKNSVKNNLFEHIIIV